MKDNTLQKVSELVGEKYTANQLHVIQNSVAKNTTATELAYFLSVCNTVGLNPFNKEVWCYKDYKGNLIIFTGRDGYLRKAQEHNDYAGHRSSEICANDKFSIDIANARIDHQITSVTDRGEILGAYCIVFRKEGEPFIEFVDIKDYKPNKVNPYSPWSHKEAAMIKKVAEAHALKQAFGLCSGVQSEHDWEIKNGASKPKGVSEQEKDDREEKRVVEFVSKIDSIDALMQVDPQLEERYPAVKEAIKTRLEYLQEQVVEVEEDED